MIEEGRGQHQPTFDIDDRKAAVADARDEVEIARLELILASHRGKSVARPRSPLLVVGGLDTVFNAVAILVERRVDGAIVLLQSGKVRVGNRDELLSRRPPLQGLRLREDRFVLESRGIRKIRPAVPRPREEALNFGDLAVLDLEAHAVHRRLAAFGHDPVKAGLLRLRVGEIHLVVT